MPKWKMSGIKFWIRYELMWIQDEQSEHNVEQLDSYKDIIIFFPSTYTQIIDTFSEG